MRVSDDLSKLIFSFREVIGDRHKETIVTMHNLAELYQTKGMMTSTFLEVNILSAIGDQVKADEFRKEIMTLIESDYQPEEWCDEGVVSSLPQSVRLKEGSLVDNRPTLDDLMRENAKRGGSGLGLG